MKNIADFRKLFEAYFTPLVKYAHSITEDKEQSKDIVQSFFVKIWHQRNTLELEDFEAFAFVSVRNSCFSWLKSQNKFLGESAQNLETVETSIIHDHHFPQYLLESAIRSLPDKCREIFVLSKLEGLTYTEIADVLNLSVKTVERQIGIGLAKLRESLHPHRELFMETLNRKP